MPKKFFSWLTILTISSLVGIGTRDANPFFHGTPAPASVVRFQSPLEMQEPEIKLALKYVSYMKSDSQQPITSQPEANRIVDRINEIYSPCEVHFVLEQYVAAQARDMGLRVQLASMADLDPTRRHFDEPGRLVIINTGEWDHQGMGTPNAWTAMPGSEPSGTVIEGRVAAYPEMIAHELGHYLNLEHVKDATDLMNPIIYRTSTRLSPDQCENVRKTALTSRSLALR